MGKDIKRSMQFPSDLYAVLKVEAKKEELSINALIIKTLRKTFNVPVKIENDSK